MPLLRLTQTAINEDQYRVEVALEGDGISRQTATTKFKFKLTSQEQEDIRWYLEDYLQYPLDPAPKIADRIEKRMAEIGAELFKAVFHADEDARDLWATLRTRLSDTRVEIATDVKQAATIPWEQIRDPKTDIPLAVRVKAFVRAYSQPAETPGLRQQETGPIRILLAICRPSGGEDVPFRSVATRLIKGLGETEREAFQLDVLRPPTYEQLARVLRQAKIDGHPYHILHFDGHGMYADVSKKSVLLELLGNLSPLILSGIRKGSHGYLLFENPEIEKNADPIDGLKIGKLLKETDVPVLVLNACRSAHAEAMEKPDAGQIDNLSHNIHTQVRAFGSLAQEVMDTGVAGVVAMRYNVYVVTVAQFVADLYAALSQGNALGEAVTLGRKQLHDQPRRTIAYQPIPLRDWCVPVVYEAAPIALFPKPDREKKLTIQLEAGDAAPQRGALDPELPKRPDAGFFGRDETLLALDRAFDSENIVLLHAFAGSGKTATAAEFARWYSLTGGIEGPVLFTSFEQYQSLVRVLDQVERFFGPSLEQIGVNWLAMEDRQRRQVALQVLKQVPVLWIWDNVEPIAGFPRGIKSAWNEAEQKELADFLRDARDTRAKFLLTSRRDEGEWLGNLPKRISVPPMPMQERVQLAKALAEKLNRKITDVEDWRPLLQFTQGNPLTITVLVGQALRDRLKTKEQIEDFVAKLRTGEAKFEDEMSEGRAKSLGASLSYGFEHAFSEEEQKILALLHFFQGFVNVQVLSVMGSESDDWALPELRSFSDETGIALLDRATEVGLLTVHGDGYYTIHPALPWYFRSLFDQYYPLENQQPIAKSKPPTATHAFVQAMGELGNHYFWQYEGGNRDVIGALTAEEANLLHARELARQHGWWSNVIGTMQGLQSLYNHTGRRAEWARLVEEIVPDFIDPANDGPLPDREDLWGLVTEYRVLLSEEARQWGDAEQLQKIRVESERKRATTLLELPSEKLDSTQRNAIRTLAASLHELGEIQREMGQPDCVKAYEEAFELAEKIGENAVAATCAFNLGRSFDGMTIRTIRDLPEAEQWYQRSLEMYEEHQRMDRAQCLGQLGYVAWERFNDARAANKPEEELIGHLQNAEQYYLQALDLLPSDAVNDLAVTHNQLGAIYHDAGNLDRALHHYREDIRYDELSGNYYGAGLTRYNVALALQDTARFEDALEYAQAALRNFQPYGEGAAEWIQNTQQLISDIKKEMGK